MANRNLNIEEVVPDMYNGMDQARLEAKYGLPNQAIEAIFRKMIQTGLL